MYAVVHAYMQHIAVVTCLSDGSYGIATISIHLAPYETAPVPDKVFCPAYFRAEDYEHSCPSLVEWLNQKMCRQCQRLWTETNLDQHSTQFI